MMDILHRLRNSFLRAGILETQDHGGQARHGVVQNLRREILKSGHIHGRTKTIPQEFKIRIFVKVLRFNYKFEVRVIKMMPHQVRLPFGLHTASG